MSLSVNPVNKSLTPVLVVTYYFPPAGGPGVQRMLKFIRYLPDYGWQPVVLTVKNGDFPAKDPTLEEEIPEEMPVIRVPAVEPYAFYRKFTGKKSGEMIPVGTLSADNSGSFPEKFAHWIRANLFIPDARLGWIFPVISAAKRIIHNYNIQALFSSSPPQSVQVAALRIAKRHGLPWVADFRDPWTDIYYYQGLQRLKLAKKLDAAFEKKVLERADAVLTVSPTIQRQLGEKIRRPDVSMIPNGYDASDFKGDTKHHYDEFSISYIGNLKANQNPSSLWNALKTLCDNDTAFASNLSLQFTGKIHPEVKESLERFALTSSLKINDYVPHYEATRQMRQTAVLLFIVPDAPNNAGILTGKLFEYLAAGRPILSIGPVDGDAADILRSAGAGDMLSQSDLVGMRSHIERLYESWQKENMKEFIPEQSKVEQYDRRQLTGELSQVLSRVSRTREYVD